MLRRATKLFQLNREEIRRHAERKAGMSRTPSASGVLEQEAVFVLSTGRCGTELLTKIFELAPATLAAHRPDPELAYPSALAYELAQRTGGGEMVEKMFLAGRFDLMLESLLRQRRYVETNNRITFFAPAIASLMPNARFIHLVRDAEGFVRSGVRRKYYEGVPTDLGRITPTGGQDLADWPNLSPIGRCAWLWAETNGFIDGFRRSLDRPDRFLSVKSKDLFSDPAVADEILRFSGLTASASVDRLLGKKVNEQLRGPDPGPRAAWTTADQDQFRRFVDRYTDA